MKQSLLILTLIIAFVFQGTAQNFKSDTIRIQKVFGGYNFIQNSKKLTVKQLVLATKTYDPAYSLMKSSQKLYVAGIITASIGGFVIGSQIGRSIDGRSPKWGIVIIGGGFALASIPLTRISIKKAVNAVGLYNSSLKQRSNVELGLSFKGNIIGLEMKF